MTIGWTLGAFISSKLTESMPLGRLVFRGACLLTAAMLGATAAVLLDLPLSVLLGLFTVIGAGLGGVSSTGLIMLQQQSTSGEMGRINSAHQFVRTLGFSYGSAIGGAVMFAVVASKLGDADAVRDLLGDADVAVDGAASAALASGYSWAMVLGAALSVVGLGAAWALNRQTLT